MFLDKIIRNCNIVYCILLCLSFCCFTACDRERTVSNVSYYEAVAKSASAVVSIQTTQSIPLESHPMLNDPMFRFFFGDPDGKDGKREFVPYGKQLQQGLGSGVIVDARGYVLTNYHVIKDANAISVRFSNGLNSAAEVVGRDSKTDLAILKIKNESLLKDLTVISLGDSDSLRVGDTVLAIGNPFGFDNTVTQGIVSALGSVKARSNEQDIALGGWLDNLIQTDAAINPGNSGGALIDVEGSLVGINVAIISRSGGSQGIGFAIPINLAKVIMEQLINSGHIVRGWLGLQLSDISYDLKRYLGFDEDYGVYVQSVVKNGPAHEAGILIGDVIIKVNGDAIYSLADAVRLVCSLTPNEKYSIEVFRKFQFLSISVIMGQTPDGE